MDNKSIDNQSVIVLGEETSSRAEAAQTQWMIVVLDW
jgi:hypothetical protein